MGFSSSDIKVMGESATRLVEVINESLKIASQSANPETKLSRLTVAKQKLLDLKVLAADYDFISIESLAEVEALIAHLDLEFEQAGYRDIANGNLLGELLEKEGKTDQAIAAYERLLARGVDTPFTYRRLAILYKRLRRPADELRAIHAALAHIPASNSQHREWFAKRAASLDRKRK